MSERLHRGPPLPTGPSTSIAPWNRTLDAFARIAAVNRTCHRRGSRRERPVLDHQGPHAREWHRREEGSKSRKLDMRVMGMVGSGRDLPVWSVVPAHGVSRGGRMRIGAAHARSGVATAQLRRSGVLARRLGVELDVRLIVRSRSPFARVGSPRLHRSARLRCSAWVS